MTNTFESIHELGGWITVVGHRRDMRCERGRAQRPAIRIPAIHIETNVFSVHLHRRDIPDVAAELVEQCIVEARLHHDVLL